MYSNEHRYLEDENATGFIKYYKDMSYGFAALLPNEDVSINEYVASLTGDKLHTMLNNCKNTSVETAIPKFDSEYDVEMSDILKTMGMPIAFDEEDADFSKLGTSTDGNISISRVLHKSFISVHEKGTKAGAATVVEMKNGSAMIKPDDVKKVYLDRPFVYMIIDCETNIPIFIGTVMDVD